ncbi:MAG: threonine synthase [Ardenticatenaceae bacterium]|nr:threonine synthase [Ardenticatenaceae bacterium]HBY99382.1 threonine synthase [Chloroflexota bacterium]
MHPGVLTKYRDFLPVTPQTPLLTLNEGDTPLIRAHTLEALFGLRELWFKFEGLNPTGSFKDRGMVMAVAKALEAGSHAIMCASTGNTSASAAAYAARAGLEAIVLVPAGNIALGKLAQALFYGAQVVAIDGTFDDALGLVRRLTERHAVTLVNSINPFRIEGQTTAAYEVVDVLGDAPEILALPVGNAGNITAYWEGFKRYLQAGHATRLPRLFGFEAAGAAPIVRGEVVLKPETIATAIKIGRPASWQRAITARDESEGVIDAVTDDEIVEAWHLLATREGLFCEPASAAGVAGLRKALVHGWLDAGSQVVCVLTGHGLKDPDNAIKFSPNVLSSAANLDAVERLLGW